MAQFNVRLDTLINDAERLLLDLPAAIQHDRCEIARRKQQQQQDDAQQTPFAPAINDITDRWIRWFVGMEGLAADLVRASGGDVIGDGVRAPSSYALLIECVEKRVGVGKHDWHKRVIKTCADRACPLFYSLGQRDFIKALENTSRIRNEIKQLRPRQQQPGNPNGWRPIDHPNGANMLWNWLEKYDFRWLFATISFWLSDAVETLERRQRGMPDRPILCEP